MSSYIEKAERWVGDTPGEDTAQVYATLAIAEQLKRIADALAALNESSESDETSATAEPMSTGTDDSIDELLGDRRQVAEQINALRRGMGLE